MSFTPIPERSDATPGLWNSRFAELNSSISSVGVGVALVDTYGGDPTGAVSSSSAVSAAIASGNGIVRFSSGTYLLTEPINLANRGSITNARPLTIEGMGTSQYGKTPTTTLLASTDSVVIDTVGTGYLTLRHFRVDAQVASGATRPANVGILVGRTVSNPFCDFHRYEDVTIFMDSRTTATAVGTVGLYNNSGEHHIYDRVRVIANAPFFLTDTNVLALDSPSGATLTTPTSMTLVDFHQTVAQAWTRAGYDLRGCRNVHLRDVYAQKVAGTQQWAVSIGSACEDLHISGQFEEFSSLLNLGSDVTGLHVSAFMSNASNPYIGWGPNVRVSNADLKVTQANGSQQFLVSGTNGILTNARVFVESGQAFVNSSTFTLRGVLIHDEAASGFTVAPNSGYLVLGPRTTASPAFMANDGSAPAPTQAFSSESSLGWYRSGTSTMALSYGSLNMNQGRLVSVRTAASLDSTSLAVNEMAFSVVQASGASLAIRSGGTIWYFSSSASTRA